MPGASLKTSAWIKVRAWLIWGGQILGRWLRGQLSAGDLGALLGARMQTGPRDLRVCGLTFPDINRLMWQLVLHILVLEEYSPKGFAVHEGQAVIDIGANRGAFVAVAARHRAGDIHAFEPDPNNHEHLARFVALNGIDNVHLRSEAVAGTSGRRKLYAASRHTRSSLLPADVISGDLLETYSEVPTISLERLLEEVGPVDLLKMDCEGAEYEIFASAPPEALKKAKRMVIEYHGWKASEPVRRLIQQLTEAGFSVRVVPSDLGEPLGMIFARLTDSVGDSMA